jgi:regulator of protease activity HflC (stomatin/prohibitin superfamily)
MLTMDAIFSLITAMGLMMIGYTVGSAKIITEGNEALVERLGKYSRKIYPGLNFVAPVLEKIVIEETTREKVLEIEPQQAITKDNVSVRVNAVIYWQVLALEKAYYAVEDVENAMETLVLTMLRSTLGDMALRDIYGARKKSSQLLLQQLDEITQNWGVKVNRVEIQELTIDKKIQEALELEWVAETKHRATILEAEANVKSIELLAQALSSHPQSKEVLSFLVAQKYVDASQQIGNSPSSKVIFMDPHNLTQAINNLMSNQNNP